MNVGELQSEAEWDEGCHLCAGPKPASTRPDASCTHRRSVQSLGAGIFVSRRGTPCKLSQLSWGVEEGGRVEKHRTNGLS